MRLSAQQKSNKIALLYRITTIAAILTTLTSVVILVMAINNTNPILYTLSGLTFVHGIIIFLCGIIGRQGKPHLAAWLIIILGFFLTIIISGYLVAGIGLALSIGVFVLIVQFAFLILPQRQANWAAVFAAINAIAILVIDLFGSESRIDLQNVRNFTLISIVLFFFFLSLILFRRFDHFSLRAKLVALMAGVTITAVLALTITVNLITRNNQIETVGNSIISVAEAQALAIGELLFQQLSTLDLLANNPIVLDEVQLLNDSFTGTSADIIAEIQEKDALWINAAETEPLVASALNNVLAEQLRNYQSLFPDHVELFITDRFGGLIAATNKTSDYYQADELWWQGAYSNGGGGVFIGEPEFDVSSNTLAINIALPIFAEGSDEIIGVLRTTYTLQALVDILTEANLSETGEFLLKLPSNREVKIIGNGEYEIREISADDSIVLSELQENYPTFLRKRQNGIPIIVSWAPITTLAHQPIVDSLGWGIEVNQAESESLAVVQTQQQVNAIVGVIILIFAVTAATLLAQRLTSPILSLSNVATRVTEGDLKAKADVQSNDEIGLLATTINTMTTQLTELIESLEIRVAERTKALSGSIEISRRLSTILDEEELLAKVTELIKSTFDYYHVQIYLFDANRENLIMQGGTGEAGKALLVSGHFLHKDQGLVGKAASTNSVVFIPNVHESSEWLPNSLLPHTNSEVVVPIVLENLVIGVLDVQHQQVNGLTEEDINVLQSIANQVAIALQNAQLLAEARERAERATMLNKISQKIQSTTTVESTIKIAAQELGEALGTPKTTVQLSTTKLKTEQNGE